MQFCKVHDAFGTKLGQEEIRKCACVFVAHYRKVHQSVPARLMTTERGIVSCAHPRILYRSVLLYVT